MNEPKFRLTAPPIQVGSLIPEYFYCKEDGGIYKKYRVVTEIIYNEQGATLKLVPS